MLPHQPTGAQSDSFCVEELHAHELIHLMCQDELIHLMCHDELIHAMCHDEFMHLMRGPYVLTSSVVDGRWPTSRALKARTSALPSRWAVYIAGG